MYSPMGSNRTGRHPDCDEDEDARDGGGGGSGGVGMMRSARASSGAAASAVYLLEHLATFAVGRQSAIGDARDGLRRLLQMEKSSGIWTQKMQLQLAPGRSLVIADHENGDIVEKFPVELIREPTSFTSDDPRELYNNIFIFIVASGSSSSGGGGGSPHQSASSDELHIFQCLGVSAQRLVEDMKAFISGQPVSAATASSAPLAGSRPPGAVSPDPAVHQLMRQTSGSSSTTASSPPASLSRHRLDDRNIAHFEAPRVGYARDRSAADVSSSLAGHDVETSSTASEQYERDVAVLNHCFDDIEKFISRLQQAAVASRELDKRRKKRSSSRKDFGDGMLSMRARAPPQSAFVEILQKFKLSFNLLAKLKAHIHDPNAPELVHFLFTPLALIVDAARECAAAPPAGPPADLPGSVLAPLLSGAAIDLLLNCLTSKESELWHSLGDTWCRPREQWKGAFPAYQPVFFDGWSPKLAAEDGCGAVDRQSAAAAGGAAGGRSVGRGHTGSSGLQSSDTVYDRHGDHYIADPYIGDSQLTRDGYRSQHSYSGKHQQQQQHQHHHHRECTPSSSEEVRESVAVLGGGGGVGGSGGNTSGSGSGDSVLGGAEGAAHRRRVWLEEARARAIPLVQVTYPRTANNDKELTVTRGEVLMVIDDSRKWWRVQNYLGHVGHVPHTIVSHLSAEQDTAVRDSSDCVKKYRQGKKGEFRYI